MPTPTVAATSTLAMVRAAQARGVDVFGVLAQAEVSLGTLMDPDARIPVPVSLAIWNTLREQTADPSLQLDAPRALPIGAYRLVDYLIGASATVGDGVRRFARFFGLVNPSVVLTASTDKRGATLEAALTQGGAVPGVYVDYIFAALIGRIRAYYRPQLRLAGVRFQHEAPADPRSYHQTFLAPVQFGASSDRLLFDRDEWTAAFETADPTLAEILEARARLRLEHSAAPPGPAVADVRRAIVGALPGGARIATVARMLHVSVRALQRRLAEGGTNYRASVDALRSDLAREYLADGTVSICEVALLLGFSDQRSFHRAFARWTGESPGRWRITRRRP